MLTAWYHRLRYDRLLLRNKYRLGDAKGWFEYHLSNDLLVNLPMFVPSLLFTPFLTSVVPVVSFATFGNLSPFLCSPGLQYSPSRRLTVCKNKQ